MRQLECGCELTPAGDLASMCEVHAAHMRARTAVNAVPHNATRDEITRMQEQELMKILAPVVLQRMPNPIDVAKYADALFQHVCAITARFT